MRGLNVDGKAVVPLRAVTASIGHSVPPLVIALAVGDPRNYDDEREFGTPMPVYKLGCEGRAHLVDLIKLTDTLKSIQGLHIIAEQGIEQIKQFPAGSFVYREDLEGLVGELNATRDPKAIPIAINDDPSLDPSEEKTVMSGLDRLQRLSAPTVRSSSGVKATHLDAVERQLTRLEGLAMEGGESFDRTRAPGKIQQLVDCVKTHSRELVSLSDDCIEVHLRTRGTVMANRGRPPLNQEKPKVYGMG